MKTKKIKIKYCDWFNPDGDLLFLPTLKKHYDVEISDNPDYLFYGPFGKEHLKYSCVKIFTTGENVFPNFNECDYATGFEYLSLQDRYLRLPLSHIMYRDGVNMMDIAKVRGSNLPKEDNKEFCSYVVSNSKGIKKRTEIFELLSKYRKVDSGGRYLNNTGYCVENKLMFDHKHKFSICFENEIYPGYTTEKLTEAFAAGTIPIYLGDPLVDKVFNTKAFINCMDYESLDKVVERVIEIDNDDNLYNQIINEPVLVENIDYIKKLETFLCNIIDQDIQKAKRTPTSYCSRNIERIGLKGEIKSLLRKPKQWISHFLA